MPSMFALELDPPLVHALIVAVVVVELSHVALRSDELYPQTTPFGALANAAGNVHVRLPDPPPIVALTQICVPSAKRT